MKAPSAAIRLVALLSLAVLASACRTVATLDGPLETAPRRAVEGFLAAVRADNPQGVGDNWGTAAGPARDRMDRTEHDQRVFVMMRCLRNDSALVRSQMSAAPNSRVLRVELFRAGTSRVTTFTTVAGPGRWFVEQIDMDPVRDLCAMR